MAVPAEIKKPELKKQRRFPLLKLLRGTTAELVPEGAPPIVEARTELPETLSDFEKRTYHYLEDFPALVGSIDPQKILVPLEGQSLPKAAPEFSLASLTPSPERKDSPYSWSRWSYNGEDENELNSLLTIGRGHVTAPAGIRVGDVYLDSATAIGLTYKDKLCAVAAGGLTHEGRLMITQIQGVKRMYSKNRKNYKDSGLHAGILWRESLVNAWIETAKNMGIDEIEIRSAGNNRYYDHPKKANLGGDETNLIHNERLVKTYDRLAQRMGFELDPQSGNFVLRLQQEPSSS